MAPGHVARRLSYRGGPTQTSAAQHRMLFRRDRRDAPENIRTPAIGVNLLAHRLRQKLNRIAQVFIRSRSGYVAPSCFWRSPPIILTSSLLVATTVPAGMGAGSTRRERSGLVRKCFDKAREAGNWCHGSPLCAETSGQRMSRPGTETRTRSAICESNGASRRAPPPSNPSSRAIKCRPLQSNAPGILSRRRPWGLGPESRNERLPFAPPLHLGHRAGLSI